MNPLQQYVERELYEGLAREILTFVDRAEPGSSYETGGNRHSIEIDFDNRSVLVSDDIASVDDAPFVARLDDLVALIRQRFSEFQGA